MTTLSFFLSGLWREKGKDSEVKELRTTRPKNIAERAALMRGSREVDLGESISSSGGS